MHGKNQGKLFKIANSLLWESSVPTLPDCKSDLELANDFGSYFSNEINVIRTKLVSESRDGKTDVMAFDKPFDGQFLANFDPASCEEVLNILSNSESETCCLDPLPTNLLKECESSVLVHVPHITDIINKSISECSVSSCFKEAVVNKELALVKKRARVTVLTL